MSEVGQSVEARVHALEELVIALTNEVSGMKTEIEKMNEIIKKDECTINDLTTTLEKVNASRNNCSEKLDETDDVKKEESAEERRENSNENNENEEANVKKGKEKHHKHHKHLKNNVEKLNNRVTELWNYVYSDRIYKIYNEDYYGTLSEWCNKTEIVDILPVKKVEEKYNTDFADYLLGKKNFMIVVKTIEGFIFGSYHSVEPVKQATEESKKRISIGKDNGHFIFSLHNPLGTPKKYNIKNEDISTLIVFKNQYETMFRVAGAFNINKNCVGHFRGEIKENYDLGSDNVHFFTGNVKFKIEDVHIIVWN